MFKKFKPLVIVSVFLTISSIGFGNQFRGTPTQATLEAIYRQAQNAVNKGLGKCLSDVYSVGAGREVEDYIRHINNQYFSDISFFSGGRVTVKLLPRSKDIDEDTYLDLADFYAGEAYTRCTAALSEYKRKNKK